MTISNCNEPTRPDLLQDAADFFQLGTITGKAQLATSVTGLGLLKKGGRVDTALFLALLGGYQAERKLQAVEKENLVNVVRYMGLIESVWALHKYGVETPDLEGVSLGNLYWNFGLDGLRLPPIV